MSFITDTGEKIFTGVIIFLIALIIALIIPINEKVVYLYNINKTQEIGGTLLSITTNDRICYWEKLGAHVISNNISLDNSEIYENENEKPYVIVKSNIFNQPIKGEFHVPEGTLQNTYELQ